MAKTRVDSVKGQIETAEMLKQEVTPPIELSPIEQQHFDNIVNSKSRRFWENGHFVQIAATTSQLMVLNNEYMQQLIAQGATIENNYGVQVANPMHAITRQTQGMIATNLRVLGMSANMIDGSDHARYEKGAKKAEAKARNNTPTNKTISLLAQ